MLKEQLPQGALVLDAGCGTGQLTNYLGMSWKYRVIGGDICLNSLSLAKAFRDRFSIRNAAFVQMNLFRLPFCNDAFDVIITNGVLHHTSDPKRAFVELLRRLKPGGLIIVGLYNTYARLPTLWRRSVFSWIGPPAYFLDSRLRKEGVAKGRWDAWFADQYKHPHESRHSQDEVMTWFDENEVDFLSGIPAPDGKDLHADDNLFVPHPRGTPLDRFAVQIGLLLEGGKDGGLFIMIGRKRWQGLHWRT
jgi:SAM-dependent methyltransferase